MDEPAYNNLLIKSHMKINLDVENIIAETVMQILEVITPVKIFLFGSAAKESFHENSDLDFLIIVPDITDKRRSTREIYKKILSIGFATDIVMITESEFLLWKDDSYYIIKSAITEGRLIYG